MRRNNACGYIDRDRLTIAKDIVDMQELKLALQRMNSLVQHIEFQSEKNAVCKSTKGTQTEHLSDLNTAKVEDSRTEIERNSETVRKQVYNSINLEIKVDVSWSVKEAYMDLSLRKEQLTMTVFARMSVLVVMCTWFTLGLAQFTPFGTVDQEWLMDDPHKTDRLPIWSRLLGNRAVSQIQPHAQTSPLLSFITLPRAVSSRVSPATNSRSYRPQSDSLNISTNANTGNTWLSRLQNFYKLLLLNRLLSNLQPQSYDTSGSDPSGYTTTSSSNSMDHTNGLRNLYQMALWAQMLGNQDMSNTASSQTS